MCSEPRTIGMDQPVGNAAQVARGAVAGDGAGDEVLCERQKKALRPRIDVDSLAGARRQPEETRPIERDLPLRQPRQPLARTEHERIAAPLLALSREPPHTGADIGADTVGMGRESERQILLATPELIGVHELIT